MPPGAIYSEPWIGSFRYVLAKDDDKLTDIDYELLYMAARKTNLPL